MSVKTDFLVIGGGIAGASAGYHLAAHGKTIVLEQESQPGYHSTGRSAAIFSEYHGPRVVCQLARASYGFFNTPPEGFSATPILVDRGMMFIGAADQKGVGDAMLLPENNTPTLLNAISSDEALKLVPFLKPEQVEVAIHYPSAREIDVAALHGGWIRGVKARGGDVVTSAKVESIVRHANGWTVKTKSETYEAGVVVNAAGAWADEVGAMAGLKRMGLVPKRRTVITVDLPPEHAKRSHPMVIFLDSQFYFKTEAGAVLASPMDTTAVDPHDVQPEDIDKATAAWLLEERTTLKVPRIKSSWAGLRSFLPDDVPVIARDPDAPNFIWLAGQGGYGIKTCDAMARCAVGIALNDDFPDDVKAIGLAKGTFAAHRNYGVKTNLIS